MMVRRVCHAVLTVALVIVAEISPTAQSQLGSGSLSGVVTDSTGGVVPDADVTVTNNGTGEVRKTTTGPSGQFTVPVLPTGEHTVRVGKTGFITWELKNVTVNVGSATTLRVVLAVGNVETVVDVKAEAPMVDATRTAEVSLIDRTEVNDLPINGRRADQFALLAPGVTRDGTFGQLSYRGFSGVFNNFTVEGNDDNEAYNGEARGRTRVASSISMNAVQEFQVGQSNFLPEFGRAAGGAINTVIRSGSNQRHADAFYYFRNQALNAQDPFASAKPDELRQQFGGSIGGPLQRDKVFYFVNYDQQRRNFPLLIQDTTGALVNGAPVLPGNPTPAQLAQYNADVAAFNAGATYLRQQLPGGAFGSSLPRHPNQAIVLGKVDWLLNPHNTLTVTNNTLHSRTDNGVSTAAVASSVANSTDAVDTETFNARLTTTITAHQLNELRFQWSRDLQVQTDPTPGPSVSVGFFSFGHNSSADRLAGPDERRIQVVENYSYIAGSHAYKFGFDFDRPLDILDITAGFQGSYRYASALTLGRDLLNPAAANYMTFSQSFGLRGITFAVRNYAAFAQDQCKPRSNLTINYGLRYDYEAMPNVVFPNPAIPETLTLNADRTNVGPRVGTAYDLKSDGKTILRAGYGMFYGLTPTGTIDNALRQTGNVDPTQSTLSIGFSPTDPGAPHFPNHFSAIPTGPTASPPFVTRLDTVLRRPRVQEVNAGVERQLTTRLSVSASYVYSYGDRLPISYDENLPSPNVTRTFEFPDGTTFQVPFVAGVTRSASGVARNIQLSRPNPNFGSISVTKSIGEQWYHGLLVEARKRFADGFQAHISYTLAKAENLAGQASFAGGAESAFGGSQVANQFDLASNKGLAPTDQRQRFVMDGVWNLPFGASGTRIGDRLLKGFRLSGIFVAESGRPYSSNITASNLLFSAADGTQYSGIGSGIYGQGGLSLLSPRNQNTGPASYRLDLRLARDLHVTERLVVEVLGEGFNLFNHPNYTQVNNTQYLAQSTTAAASVSTPIVLTPTTNFGVPSADSGFPDGTNARRFQVAVRLRY